MSVDVLTGSRQEALKEILRKADEDCGECGNGGGGNARLFLIVSIACAAVYLFLRK